MTEPSAPSFNADDPEFLERDGAGFAHQAVQNDQAGQFEAAAFYYNVSIVKPSLSHNFSRSLDHYIHCILHQSLFT